MKHNSITIIRKIAAAAAAFALLPLYTQEPREKHHFDFSLLQQKNGTFVDDSGKGFILPGKKTAIGEGPCGLKSLVFDGTTATSAQLDLTAGKADFEGFEFSVSYWIKYRYFGYAARQKTSGVAGSGNNSGLGFNINYDSSFVFSFDQLGPGKFMWRSAIAPGFDTWHHIAMTYSAVKREATLYLDGDVHQHMKLDIPFPLRLPYGKIAPLGCFRGELAGIRIWDHIVSEDELTAINATVNTFSAAVRELDGFKTDKPSLRDFLTRLRTDIENGIKKGKITVREYYAIDRRIKLARQLCEAARSLAGTTLRDAPFAFMGVQPCSPIIRTPDKFPSDAVFTDMLELAAARGEYEPLSFAVVPEKDGKLEFTHTDFKSAEGHVIPASELDRKLVKCWYQASWTSDHNPWNQVLVPDLLLNDFDMVHVDEIKRLNYLRFQYPDGPKWENVSFGGTFETVKKFNYLISPTWDAPEFMPVPLTTGRTQQFWFTFHAPKDAKPGVYESRVSMKLDGQDAGSFVIRARVYPFELPVQKTYRNPDQLYITYTIGEARLQQYAEMTGELDEAARILKLDVENMVRHNVLNQTVSSIGVSSRDLVQRDVEIRREAGALLKPFWSGLSNASGLLSQWGKSGDKNSFVTPERVRADRAAYFKGFDEKMAFLKNLVGHSEIFFDGFDENRASESLTFQSTFRKDLLAMGYRIATTGWKDNYTVAPAWEDLHYNAGRWDLDPRTPEKWHAIGGLALTYAAPFAGPDNPDLMRRSHGLEFYKMGYDGYLMLSYVAGLYIWNERVNGAYRNFLMAYPTSKGPVNTISFEGLREGLDDIRYATLLCSLIREAQESGDREVRLAAGRAALFLEKLKPYDIRQLDPYDTTINLDTARKNMAGHILKLRAALHKD